MDAEDGDYVCTLNEYTLEKAIRELNEDPKERLGSVQALRRWIREQPHYTCNTDTRYLLAILRKTKFSQLGARELVDNILTMRTQCPEFLVNFDFQDPAMFAFLEKGIIFPLPKPDKEGRTIWLTRPGAIDLNDPLLSPTNEMRYSMAILEYIRDTDENTHVNGFVIVTDCSNVSMKYITRASMDTNKKTMKIFQECNPGRSKAFIMYNVGSVFEFALTLFKPLMKKKFLDRLFACDTMESLYKIVPMELWPMEYLPDDYKGPSAGTIQDITTHWKGVLMNPKHRQRILDLTSDRYRVDESKRPAVDKQTPRGSFRRLAVD